MSNHASFHVLTIGWDHTLVERLCDRIGARSGIRFSHLLHPRYVRSEWPQLAKRDDILFFRHDLSSAAAPADGSFLAGLEQPDLPTVHNMIMGDRVVSRLPYPEALGYATFLARRMTDVLGHIRPSVALGGFDALHGSLALAVCRHSNVPWFALHFSVIPPGLACFCDRISPAARVRMTVQSPTTDVHEIAEAALEKFENKRIQAPAYIAPPPRSFAETIANVPARLRALVRTVQRSRTRELRKFTEGAPTYHVPAALTRLRRAARARNAIASVQSLDTPPAGPYVFFGLHYQPESSIDVWAPFFSNQMWVIELLSRAIPPSHKLLVKIHKSDVSNYTSEQLRRVCSFPGVELVRPFAETRSFIENAGLVVSIQGTIGLEAALLGKPVIALGDSPIVVFPSASRIGAIPDLPQLVRRKLAEPRPPRRDIIAAYGRYLAPFMPASHNDWTAAVSDQAIEGYVTLFRTLRLHVEGAKTVRSLEPTS